MPLFFSPGQYATRSQFYFQFAQFIAAGLSLTTALEHLERQGLGGSYRTAARCLREDIAAGFSFAEGMQRLGRWMPEFDLALVGAGEQSGRLDVSFRVLAEFYRERAQRLRELIGDLLYPLFLFHFAVFLLPFPALFISGNWMVYLGQTLGVLVPFYAVIALLIYAAQGGHGEEWRARVESVLRAVPMIGTAKQCLALSRLSLALEGLLNAGVGIVQAWELAAAASGSPAFRRVVMTWRAQVDAGRTPAEILAESDVFPELFASQYASGEISGKLEEVLQRMHRYYQEEGSRKIHLVTMWAPRLFYFAVVLMVAYRILQFYSGYFRQIRDAGGF